MFEPGERVIFCDLDTLIVGDLGDIASYSGRFAMQRDFFHSEAANSGMMAWEAGAVDHIWTRWDEAGRPSFAQGGDQNWIAALEPDADRLQDLYPDQIVSFKRDCWLRGRIPEGARVCGYHGRPRPHECRAPYIVDIWNRPLLAA
jgi:hypothetical protein